MNKTELMNNITRKINNVGFTLKKHSPEVLVVAGVVGVVTSAVMACKATLKVNEVVEDAKKDIEAIHVATEKGETPSGEKYTAEDSKKELTVVYAQTGVKFVKLYGPAVALGALSVTGIVASHQILRKRNIALAAAYNAVHTSFKEYRGRIEERFGKEFEREIRYNIKAKEIEETMVDGDGNETTEKKVITVAENDIYSDYARFYDCGNKGWTDSPEMNLYFLRRMQDYANEKLKAKGYLFLNDVYEMLGMYKSVAGQSVGWVYNPDDPDHDGDNYIDFGLYDTHKKASREFVNGYEPVIIVDFNVDGNIMNKLKKAGKFA